MSQVRITLSLQMPAFVVAIALYLSAVSGVGNPDEVRFRRMSVNDGLSQSQVSVVMQDSDGYLWFGTRDGLNRYDGYGFTVFKHDPDDANSLSHNYVTAMYEDRSGVLWIGTREGLNRYNRHTHRVQRFLHDPEDSASISDDHVTTILQQRNGAVWVGTLNGLNLLTPESDTFRHFRYVPSDTTSISSNGVRTIFEDGTGNLWVGTNFGLNRYAPQTETFERIPSIGGVGEGSVIASIHGVSGDDGKLWIASLGAGFGIFDVRTGEFSRYSSENSLLTDDRVTTVYEDRSGNVWAGTLEGGVYRLERDSGSMTAMRHDPRDGASLSDDRVTAIFEDGQRGLWIATHSGVNRADYNSKTFVHIRREPGVENTLSDNVVSSVAADSSGVLWVGTFSGGLNRIDRSSVEISHYRYRAESDGGISSDGPLAVYMDRSGTLWIGTPAGLDRYDPVTDSFTNYVLTPKRSGGHYMNAVVTMLEDHRGVLWVGSRGGLFKFDRRKEEFQRVGRVQYRPATGTDAREGRRAREKEPLSVAISALHEDSNHNLWVGSLASGLFMLDPSRTEVVHYVSGGPSSGRLSHNSVQAVFERPREPGVIWVGTYSGGLNRLDVRTGAFVHYTEQNSKLPTNTVIGILGDERGRLWLGTHKGLVRFDPDSPEIRVFDVDRGIQSREFNYGAVHRSPAGEMIFGGINGLNVFFPEQIVDDPHPPEIVLTDFKLFNTSVGFGGDSVLPRAISGVERIELEHDQNDISFEYVGLHFAAPEQNTYAYMLENYDQEWRWVGPQRSAIYTSLDPGEYVFRVKGANSDGVWNEKGASVKLVVRPPWWSTSWAWIVYGAFLIGGVMTMDRLQKRRLIARERARAELLEIRLKAQAAEAQALVLQTENERQTRELEEARELQLSMLPDALPDHPMVEIAAEMKTATEVGGDYYDYVLDSHGTLTLVIGDATGHGANAGTMVTATKSLFNALAHETDLLEVVRKSNAALKSMSLRKLYMALAVAKFHDYELELVGAGMPPALVYRSASGSMEEIPLKGMPLGTFMDYPYRKTRIVLEPGDVVVLMTDGFPELFSSEREMLGYKRVRDVFEEVADRSPAEIISHFLNVGSSWTNGQGRDDDMTFIVMKAREVPIQGLSEPPELPGGTIAADATLQSPQ